MRNDSVYATRWLRTLPTATPRRTATLGLLIASLLIHGCTSAPSIRPTAVPSHAPTTASTAAPTPTSKAPFRNAYTQDRDSAPNQARDIDFASLPDASPRHEPRGKYGNKSPYTVNGKTYTVLADARGYRAQGQASWYGEKFHGHRTSSFEPYDMYEMTAAHTSLPIPSYVRVTNLDNQRSVVVRVNDRGPFHSGRIIDLSWAAAHKLGYAAQGIANVRVEAITPDAPENNKASAKTTDSRSSAPAFYVQLGAFTRPDAAQYLGEQTRRALTQRAAPDDNKPVTVIAGADALHRVRSGPYDDRSQAEQVRDFLRNAGLGVATLIAIP